MIQARSQYSIRCIEPLVAANLLRVQVYLFLQFFFLCFFLLLKILFFGI